MDLLTLGHSSLPQSDFLGLLEAHGVDVVLDVRSDPWSRRHPHFQREPLREALARAGRRYVFLGAELGARPRDSRLRGVDDQGRALVDWGRLARTPAFRAGLAAVRREAARGRPALLCAEREPLACHRTLLVCRHLRGPDLSIHHLLGGGRTETHAETEARMLREARLDAPDLFRGPDERLERAYDVLGAKIAWRPPG